MPKKKDSEKNHTEEHPKDNTNWLDKLLNKIEAIKTPTIEKTKSIVDTVAENYYQEDCPHRVSNLIKLSEDLAANVENAATKVKDRVVNVNFTDRVCYTLGKFFKDIKWPKCEKFCMNRVSLEGKIKLGIGSGIGEMGKKADKVIGTVEQGVSNVFSKIEKLGAEIRKVVTPTKKSPTPVKQQRPVANRVGKR